MMHTYIHTFNVDGLLLLQTLLLTYFLFMYVDVPFILHSSLPSIGSEQFESHHEREQGVQVVHRPRILRNHHTRSHPTQCTERSIMHTYIHIYKYILTQLHTYIPPCILVRKLTYTYIHTYIHT